MTTDLVSLLCNVPVPSDPSISPDATTIVYSLAEPATDVQRLWCVDRATGAITQLTDGPADTSPRFAPGGSRIAFLRSTDGGAPQLWTVPVTGGPATRLTDRPLGAGAPQWSPDGARIAFTAAVELPGARHDDDPVVITRPGFRLDGIGLRGHVRRHLFVLTVRTGEVEQLTDGDWNVGSPCWSPDGAELAVIGVRDPRGDTPLSGRPYRLRYEPGRRCGPEPVSAQDMVWTLCWDPAGDALVLGRLAARSRAEPRLLRVPLDEDVVTDLLAGSNLLVPQPIPGGGLLVGAIEAGVDRLYVVGDGPARPVPIAMDCRIDALETAEQRPVAAALVRTAQSYGELATIDLTSGELRTLTRYTSDVLGDVRLAEPEPRSFVISDGTVVSGWLLRGSPQGFPAPTLLDIHGGPAGDWSPAPDIAFPYQQALVAAGWNVLLLNPRGSIGYGDAFHAASYGRQGLADEADVLEPLDQLERAGDLDPDALFVTGYSYGGYLTCWLTTRTDRFRAAVASGLHCDLTSLAGMSDVGPGMMELIYGGVPWRVPEVVRRQSPIEHVADVRTPTLLLQGEHDQRNPVGQAELWFNALHDLGVECELVIYPQADHQFLWSGRRSHRLDYARRVIAWLTAHRGDTR